MRPTPLWGWMGFGITPLPTIICPLLLVPGASTRALVVLAVKVGIALVSTATNAKRRPGFRDGVYFFICQLCLDNPSFFEGFVGAVFCNGLDCLGRDSEGKSLSQLWHKNTLFLEVWLLTHLTCRVKFGCTNTVAVAASNF